jgi:hypothetical protein
MLALSLVLAVTAPAAISFVSADETTDLKTSVINNLNALISKYEAQIITLQTENKMLSEEIARLKGTTTATTVTVPTTVTASGTIIPNTTTTPNTTVNNTPVAINTGTAKYDKLVQMTNEILVNTLSTNNIDPKATIGLYEFIEPNAFFISIDDGKNTAGITAFPYKFLYTYDKNYTITQIGFFKLDQRTELYVTISGNNPYAKISRIRVKNPLYKGKLLDEVATTTPSSTSGTTTTTTSVTKPATTTPATTMPENVTFADIKKAYDKNDVINAVKLSDAYLAKNEGNADIYRIRYRSYYIIGKYTDALDAVKKLEALNPTDFSKVIACDAVFIAKLAKQPTTQTYYAGLCKK